MIPRFLKRLLRHTEGATAIEMGFLVALISVAIIGSLHAFSNQLNNTLFIAANNIVVEP